MAFMFIMVASIWHFRGCTSQPVPKQTSATPTIFKYATTPPDSTVRVLFMHHSCGGNWVADLGPTEIKMPGVDPGSNLYVQHPNGGGLRMALSQIKTSNALPAYELHEVGRKSLIGDQTNVCHWYTKFTTLFDRADSSQVDMLNAELQDLPSPGQQQNEIIMFKSCYPNSDLDAGDATSNPLTDEIRTMGNYKAVYTALLNDVFRVERNGENRALFVVVTAPPQAKKNCNLKQADVIREFNNWLRTEWLAAEDSNVVVFDYYNINTSGVGNDLDGSWVSGTVNYSAYLTGGDSHPNHEAQTLSTTEFMRFINLAYNRWKGKKAI
jgi:hypothetical protein